MNTLEKALKIAGLLLAIGGLGLRLAHSADYPTTGQRLITLSFLLGLLAYRHYSRRLQARNQALEDQLSRVVPPQ